MSSTEMTAHIARKVGHDWAKFTRDHRRGMATPDGPVDSVRVMLDSGQVPEPLRILMRRAGVVNGTPIDPTTEDDFWPAFVDGVRQYVAEQTQLGMGSN
jgi:hypothetical protein